MRASADGDGSGDVSVTPNCRRSGPRHWASGTAVGQPAWPARVGRSLRGELPHRAEQGHQHRRAVGLILEEARRKDGHAALARVRRHVAVRGRGGHRGFPRIRARGARDLPPSHTERGAGRRRSDPAGRGTAEPQAVVVGPVVQLERAPQRVAAGVEREYQARGDLAVQETDPGLDRPDQRARRQHHRGFPAGGRLQPALSPGKGVGIPDVRLGFEGEQRRELGPVREIPKPDAAAGIDPDGNPAVADAGIEQAYRTWRVDHGMPSQAEPSKLPREDRDPHDLDLVLIRVVSRSIEPIVRPAPAEDLERGAAEGGGEVASRARGLRAACGFREGPPGHPGGTR